MPEDGNGDNGVSRLERAIEALRTAQFNTTDNVDKLAKKIDRLVEKIESGEPRFQALLALRLRMEKKLFIILSMLERQQGQ